MSDWRKTVDEMLMRAIEDRPGHPMAAAVRTLANRVAEIEKAAAEHIVDGAIHVSPRVECGRPDGWICGVCGVVNEPYSVEKCVRCGGTQAKLGQLKPGIEFAVAWLRKRAKIRDSHYEASYLDSARIAANVLRLAADELEKGEKP